MEVKALKSRGQQTFRASFLNKNGDQPIRGMFILSTGNPSFSEGPDCICFSDGVPVAVISGGYCYIQDTYRSRQVTSHINKFIETTESQVSVRMSPDEFDFVLGSVLSKLALPLTRRRPTDGEG